MRGALAKSCGALTLGLGLLLMPAAGCSNEDAKLNERVKDRIGREQAAMPPDQQVSITTKGRIVRIEGLVDNDNARERVERAVREVNGVMGIDNRLAVRQPAAITGANEPEANPGDLILLNSIRQNLDKAMLGDVSVEVRDRVVTLRGVVDKSEHDAALRAASDLSHDVRVIDHMTVR